MIDQLTYKTALTTAEALAAKGVFLSVAPSSVLGELVDASASVVTQKTTEMPVLLANPGVRGGNLVLTASERAGAVYYTTMDGEDVSLHTKKLQAIAEDIVPLVTSHVSFARNTVAPIVTEFAHRLDDYLKLAKPIDPTSLFEIEQRRLPAILLDENLLTDELTAYRDIAVKPRNFSVSLPVPEDDAAYYALINLGNDRLNGLVQTWLMNKDPSFLKNFVLMNFVDIRQCGDITNLAENGYYATDGSSTNPYNLLDNALLLFIISKNLLTNPPSVATDNVAKFKAMLRDLVDYAGSSVCKALRVIQRQIEGKVLVSELSLTRKKVVVHQALYEEWLKAGNVPEILLGMIASGDVSYNASVIAEKKDRYLRQWENFVLFSQADIQADLKKRFVSYVRALACEGLSELTPLEAEYANDHLGHRDRVLAKIDAEIEHLSHRVTEDVYHTALHVIAKGRFFYTSSYAILFEMTQVAKASPDIDPREAALLSVIAYLADYFEVQVELSK